MYASDDPWIVPLIFVRPFQVDIPSTLRGLSLNVIPTSPKPMELLRKKKRVGKVNCNDAGCSGYVGGFSLALWHQELTRKSQVFQRSTLLSWCNTFWGTLSSSLVQMCLVHRRLRSCTGEATLLKRILEYTKYRAHRVHRVRCSMLWYVNLVVCGIKYNHYYIDIIDIAIIDCNCFIHNVYFTDWKKHFDRSAFALCGWVKMLSDLSTSRSHWMDLNWTRWTSNGPETLFVAPWNRILRCLIYVRLAHRSLIWQHELLRITKSLVTSLMSLHVIACRNLTDAVSLL